MEQPVEQPCYCDLTLRGKKKRTRGINILIMKILSHPIRSELEAFIEESVNFGVVVFLDPPINVK